MATKKKSAAPKRKSFARKPESKKAGPRKGPARKGPAGKGRAGKGPARRAPARAAKAPKAAVRKAPPRPPRARRPAPPAASPAPAAAAAGPAQPDGARDTAFAVAKAGLDKKAEDVLVLDVRGLTSYADYFVVMTADSDRQASAIADHLEQTMKDQGVSKVGAEGYEGGRWILVDYGDVVAHVMNRESRGFYDLEGLWADAPRFTVDA